jgi:enamine deaminase RidA (YjgF/YER057c/UK114 family)
MVCFGRLTFPEDVEMVNDPKPCRTCVCVKELPFKTDVSPSLTKSFKLDLNFRFQVEIECIAHL